MDEPKLLVVPNQAGILTMRVEPAMSFRVGVNLKVKVEFSVVRGDELVTEQGDMTEAV